ncbi:CCR4-NOT transcription complex subunit 9-like [Telopea speciosissima]|uniref:CCR4-NOT transcription complex subunit 9-like n=1 Tax=Telopea speciosissima TaxID=54955 RepID=UPI001CC80080|nr:CCR4-NOT transcription complex subunit 9-like [Telopea speciosissima]
MDLLLGNKRGPMRECNLAAEVATFIVQKIMLHDMGLNYIFTKPELFVNVTGVLGTVVQYLAKQPSPRLLKYIIRCYLRLSDNPSICDALRTCLPEMFRDSTFNSCLHDDPTTKRCLQLLIHNVPAADNN